VHTHTSNGSRPLRSKTAAKIDLGRQASTVSGGRFRPAGEGGHLYTRGRRLTIPNQRGEIMGLSRQSHRTPGERDVNV